MLLQTDPFLTAGGGGTQADGSWYRYVSEESCHRFLDAKTAVDYIAIADEIHAEAVPGPTAPPIGRPLRRPLQTSGVSSVDLVTVIDTFQPRIRDACRRLVVDEYLPLAIHKATIALRDLLREVSGLDLDGDRLVGAALSSNNGPPPVIVADLYTETGRNIQRGTMLLAQGIFASMRNVVAHNDVEFAPAEALEMLATISLVARRSSAPEAS